MTGYLYLLIVHLSAFALFTGALVSDIIIHQQLWSNAQTDIAVSKALFATTARYTKLMGISLGIALLAGIAMMSQMHQVYGPQLWIRIKIALVVILLVLRVLSGRNSKRLKGILFDNSIIPLIDIKKKAMGLQLAQLVILVAIIILSVQKIS